MFIATLTFTQTADDVAASRERHVAWLARPPTRTTAEAEFLKQL